MNEHDNTFDLTDSILRVFGIIGFFAAVIFGFVVAGGNLITLVHPAEIIIVLGTIFFRPFMYPSLKVSDLPAQSVACPYPKTGSQS